MPEIWYLTISRIDECWSEEGEGAPSSGNKNAQKSGEEMVASW